MDSQIQNLSNILKQFTDELRKNKPDKSILKKIIDSLTNTWVPGVITSILGNVLTRLF